MPLGRWYPDATAPILDSAAFCGICGCPLARAPEAQGIGALAACAEKTVVLSEAVLVLVLVLEIGRRYAASRCGGELQTLFGARC